MQNGQNLVRISLAGRKPLALSHWPLAKSQRLIAGFFQADPPSRVAGPRMNPSVDVGCPPRPFRHLRVAEHCTPDPSSSRAPVHSALVQKSVTRHHQPCRPAFKLDARGNPPPLARGKHKKVGSRLASDFRKWHWTKTLHSAPQQQSEPFLKRTMIQNEPWSNVCNLLVVLPGVPSYCCWNDSGGR